MKERRLYVKESYKDNFFRKVDKEWVFEERGRGHVIEANIDKHPVSPKCRLCGTKEETIVHLVSGCPELAQEQYKRRHDNVVRRVHWELCKKHGLESSRQVI